MVLEQSDGVNASWCNRTGDGLGALCNWNLIGGDKVGGANWSLKIPYSKVLGGLGKGLTHCPSTLL